MLGLLLLLAGGVFVADAACNNVCTKDNCLGTWSNPIPSGQQWYRKQQAYTGGCCLFWAGDCDMCCDVLPACPDGEITSPCICDGVERSDGTCELSGTVYVAPECCTDLTAECLSCAFETTLEEFCVASPTTPGCSSTAPTEQVGCKPVVVEADFNITSFISAKWFIQKQMAISYLPVEQNYCVSAEYRLGVNALARTWGYEVQVRNLAYEADGTVHDSGTAICARTPDKSVPSKLEVGPCAVPRIAGLTTGPYWVLRYDEEQGYAVISGGQPSIPTRQGLCKTGDGVNNSGLWIFTRAQERNERLIRKAERVITENGVDVAVLNDVDQTNCQR